MNLKIARIILIISIIPPFLLSLINSLQSPTWIHSTEGIALYYLVNAILLFVPLIGIIFILLKRKVGLILAILFGIIGLISYGPITGYMLTQLPLEPMFVAGATIFAIFLVLSIITIILSILLLKKE